MECSLPIQEGTYKALRTLKFYDPMWELTSFTDGGYAEFRENGNYPLSGAVRGIRLRNSVLTLVEFPITRITKSDRVSIGAMSAEEEKSGDWARLEFYSHYIENVLPFFYDFPLRSREPSGEEDSHRLEYNCICKDVEDMLQRVIICKGCIHGDGWCSYYQYDDDRPYVKVYRDGNRITLHSYMLTLSLNPCRYSMEELHRWMKAFRLAMDSIAEISPSSLGRYPWI